MDGAIDGVAVGETVPYEGAIHGLILDIFVGGNDGCVGA